MSFSTKLDGRPVKFFSFVCKSVCFIHMLFALYLQDRSNNYSALLAMAVGISQKENVDRIVSKVHTRSHTFVVSSERSFFITRIANTYNACCLAQFLMENFAVILFHYDGNVDGWHDLEWSNKAIHILARSQTKW